MDTRARQHLGIALALMVVTLVGCRTAYYGFWDTFGVQKRHLLRDTVNDIQDDQQDVGEEFQDALTRLKQMYQVKPTELESFYGKLKSEYDDCAATAKAIHDRTQTMNDIAADLFKEWDQEIDQIETPKLQMESRRKLGQTQARFRTLQQNLAQSSGRMDSVLRKLNDQVIYLKHNLNAQAVGALEGEAADIEKEIAGLIADMNKSIAEGNSFIEGL